MKTPADQPKRGLGPHKYRVAVTSYYYFDGHKEADRFASAQADLADNISSNGNLPVLLGGTPYSPGPVHLDDIQGTHPPLMTAGAMPPEVYANKANRAGASHERQAAKDKAEQDRQDARLKAELDEQDERLRAVVAGWPTPVRWPFWAAASVIGRKVGTGWETSWAADGLRLALLPARGRPLTALLGPSEFLYIRNRVPSVKLFDPYDLTRPPPFGFQLCPWCSGHYVSDRTARDRAGT